ncbi:MAG TPA: arginine--tRNA ligase [Vicinamibacterales bacterium]|nr:arginine--tRNA ligase [Vicinamibacterales bacterium]
MILPVHQSLRTAVAAAIRARFGLDADTLPPMAVEIPPARSLGDLAVPVAFELARRLRRPPRAVAEELRAALPPIAGAREVRVAPNGYLNVFLDRPAFLLARLTGAVAPAAVAAEGKTIVEHTAINPNKAAHIGHLRNAALGDTLVRLLRFRGTRVEVQNYIDDTGVQVADVVVGFEMLEGKDLEAIRRLADATRFDYYCWDLYARVTEWYEADRARLACRARVLHDIETGTNPAAETAAFIADRIVRCHLRTMARLNVDYDLLAWEGDILRLRFWEQAFEVLKAHGAVYRQTDGPLAGCWVMPIDDGPGGSADDGEDENEGDRREKVIVRSDGTVTYIGKDIAYQLWKFGLLGRDFHYRVFARRDGGRPLWATSAVPAALEPGLTPPAFGGASAVYNVIDVRQSYLQRLLRQALLALGHAREAERSIHFAYEMVALSHATARELGYTEVDPARPFVEVSGRKGLGVKADDLLDRLVEKAHAEVTARNPDMPEAERRRAAETIAAAAVRYFMIKYSRGKVIAFDIDEALSFEGESGPYLQYAIVRARNIFQKMREREGGGEAEVIEALASASPDVLTAGTEADELWDLVLQASRLDEAVEQAIRSLELSIVAKYAFGLAQAFNTFYHRYPILAEERRDVRLWRAAVAAYCRAQLSAALSLMGCEVPARM